MKKIFKKMTQKGAPERTRNLTTTHRSQYSIVQYSTLEKHAAIASAKPTSLRVKDNINARSRLPSARGKNVHDSIVDTLSAINVNTVAPVIHQDISCAQTPRPMMRMVSLTRLSFSSTTPFTSRDKGYMVLCENMEHCGK